MDIKETSGAVSQDNKSTTGSTPGSTNGDGGIAEGDQKVVWEEAVSSGGMRHPAATHAAAAVLGAAVTIGVIAATIGLSPRVKVIREPAPAVSNDTDGVVPTAPVIPEPTNPASPSVTQGATTPTPKPGAPKGGVAAAPSPPVTGGDPLPILRGGSLLPPPNITLPPLTTLPKGGTSAFGPMSPGAVPGNVRLPAKTASNGKTAAKPAIKGPLAPAVRAGSGSNAVAATVRPPSVPPLRATVGSGGSDQEIAEAKRAVDARPNDPQALERLERLYRQRSVQADRLDEMEKFRNLADEASVKAKSLKAGSEKPSGGDSPAPGGGGPTPAGGGASGGDGGTRSDDGDEAPKPSG